MIAYVFKKYSENFAFQLFIILQQYTREICYFLKSLMPGGNKKVTHT